MTSLQEELASTQTRCQELQEGLELRERRVREVEILLRERGGGEERGEGEEQRLRQMEVSLCPSLCSCSPRWI